MHAGALTVLGRCVSVRAMARDLPHGTVTLMFTDIEGSTRLLRELGDGYADVLAEHRQRVREVIAAYRGAEVDTQGDAFFVAFTRASDAASAAADIQQALRHGTVSIRIGLAHRRAGRHRRGVRGHRRAPRRAHHERRSWRPSRTLGANTVVAGRRRTHPRPGRASSEGHGRARAAVPARRGILPTLANARCHEPPDAGDPTARARA